MTGLSLGCGGTVVAGSGAFTSPGYPFPGYPNNVNCVWTLYVPVGGFLRLQFTELRTEQW